MTENSQFKETTPPAAATAGGASRSSEALAHCSYAKSKELRKKENQSKVAVTFRGDNGEVWKHRGKVGRVLELLANQASGVTQYTTYPWHTRLAASIEILRKSGLAIETKREGEFRHARYHLVTKGTLVCSENEGVDAQ